MSRQSDHEGVPATHPVKGIDHCFSLVADLDGAVAQFTALGFTLSPRGMHSEAKGTANHTIMFANDYFELLGLVRPTPLNAARYEILKTRGEGLHAIACRIDDARAARDALDSLGIGIDEVSDFERPVDIPGGGQAMAAFSTLAFAAGEVPIGMMFMCQHRSPAAVWLPDLLEHPNTACGLAGLVAQSDRPEADATAFAALFAEPAPRPCEGGVALCTGPESAPLILLSPQALAQQYEGIDTAALPHGTFAALQVAVRDMQAVTGALDQAGIPAIRTRRGLAVGPAHAAGAIVEFVCP